MFQFSVTVQTWSTTACTSNCCYNYVHPILIWCSSPAYKAVVLLM